MRRLALSDPEDDDKPERDMDDPVSLDPLEFEEAVRALLEVDPAKDESRNDG
jgi:hypothetical protein